MEQSPALAKLRDLVSELGSQAAAAEYLGISESYVSEILKGTRPLSETVLEKLGFKRVIKHIPVRK